MTTPSRHFLGTSLLQAASAQITGAANPLASAAEVPRVQGVRTVYLALEGGLADIPRAAAAAEVSVPEYRAMPGLYELLPDFSDTRDAVTRIAAMGYQLCVLLPPADADATARERWRQRHYAQLPTAPLSSAAPWGESVDLLVDSRGPAGPAAAVFRGQALRYAGRWEPVLEALRQAAQEIGRAHV
jgi:hypothetical protein